MNNRLVKLALATVLLFAPFAAYAQQAGKVHKIGYLAAGKAKSYKARLKAFRQGLKVLGYIEGKNILIEERYAARQRNRLPALAAQLVGLQIDVFVTNGGSSTLAADRATKGAGRRIPVIFALAADPVGTGLVKSLAQPRGNITGLSNSHGVLVSKRLELLKEAVPAAKLVAVLWSPRAKNGPRQLKALQAAAPRLGVKLLPVRFEKSADLDRAFATIRTARADALNVFSWSLAGASRRRIAKAAIKNKLPTILTSERYVTAGGMMAYGVNPPDLYRRAAVYVHKVLKGAKPADLPVQLPTKFKLVVNLKTAKALGITFPSSILLRADKVFE
jgi:putative ABC transport system substrate-binding protein